MFPSPSIFALAPYAAFLGVFFAWLSLRVAMMRGRNRKTPGAVAADKFDRSARTQNNFAEYVPFALLLLAFAATGGASHTAINGFAALLVLSRLAHAYGLLVEEPGRKTYAGRTFGMLGTVVVIVGGSALLFVQWAHL